MKPRTFGAWRPTKSRRAFPVRTCACTAPTPAAPSPVSRRGVIARAGISNADLAGQTLAGRVGSVQKSVLTPAPLTSRRARALRTPGIAVLPWSPRAGIAGSADLASRHQAVAWVAADDGVSID